MARAHAAGPGGRPGEHLPEKSLPEGVLEKTAFLTHKSIRVSDCHPAGDTWAPAEDPGGVWALATARSPKGSAPYGLGRLLTHTSWPVT